MVLLDAATFGEVDLAADLVSLGELSVYPHTDAKDIAQRIEGAAVVVTNKVPINAALMAANPSLGLVCVAATGTDNVDLAAASERGITVCNVPGYSTSSVVSHTLALYFHLSHQLAYLDTYVRSGAWSQSPIFTHLERPFRSISTKTWGVVGMGAIGRGVAKAVAGLGARVIYHSTSGRNLDQPYEQLSLQNLCSKSDVVSLHAPLNDKTRGLINRQSLGWMKPQAILINVARGALVDAQSLLAALASESIGGVAIDVLEREPPDVNDPLASCRSRRLLMSPHVAGLSSDARVRLAEEVVLNISAFLQGKPRNRVA